MSFAVFVDGSGNLPRSMLDGISMLPCEYTLDGEPHTYLGDLDSFDGAAYYKALDEGHKVQTSLLNTHLFVTHFTPVLEEGRDIIYVSMSAGISGTCNAARIAATSLTLPLWNCDTVPTRVAERRRTLPSSTIF